MVHRLFVCLLPLAACSEGPAGTSSSTDSGVEESPEFSLIAVPDTQYYTLDYPVILDEMVAWVVEQAETEQISFVLGEGDITHENSAPEWEAATAAMSQLDGVVPYALAVGNHDMDGAGDTTLFNTAFPRSYMSTLPGFLDTADPATMDDSAYLFSAGGVDWIVLSMSWTRSAQSLEWAAQMLEAHADRKALLTTHAYLLPSGQRGPDGRELREQLVGPSSNVVLVINGHYIAGTAAHLVSEAHDGHLVAQIFANYQTEEFGGRGKLRLMRVDTEAGSISVSTHSPYFDVWETDAAHDFVIEGLDLR